MLRGKRQRFVDEYLIDLNASDAARRAGYQGQYVDRVGRELLALTPVQDAIALRQKELQAQVAVRQEQVLLELKRIAFSDMRAVATWGPDGVTLLDSQTLLPAAAVTVQEVKSTKKTRTWYSAEGELHTETEVQTSLKLWSKLQALDGLAKHLGLFRDPDRRDVDALLDFLVGVVVQHVPHPDTRQEIISCVQAYCGGPFLPEAPATRGG